MVSKMDGVQVGAIGSTQKVCSPAVMDQEARYFRALARSQWLRLDGSFLLVYSDGSNQPLKFTQIPVPLPSPIRRSTLKTLARETTQEPYDEIFLTARS